MLEYWFCPTLGGAQCSLQEEQSWLQEDCCCASREAQEVSPQEEQSLLQLLGLLLEEQLVQDIIKNSFIKNLD